MTTFLTANLQPLFPLRPEHIVVTAGLTLAIESLVWALANEGDGVLLGRPYYTSFIHDMGERAKYVSLRLSAGAGQDVV